MTKTIVMIHGMWHGGWNWEKYKNFFEGKGYQCHTPYLRYHDVDPKDDPDPRLGTTSLLDCHSSPRLPSGSWSPPGLHVVQGRRT